MKLQRLNKRGVALITVILLCLAVVSMIGILSYNFKAKRGTQEVQALSTKALMAANAAMQLGIYKFRILPSEYYHIHEMGLKEVQTGVTNPEFALAKKAWIDDINGKDNFTTAAEAIKARFSQDGYNYDFGIDSFDLVSLKDDGYVKDYIKIKAWGSCNNMRKDIEELVEVSVSH